MQADQLAADNCKRPQTGRGSAVLYILFAFLFLYLAFAWGIYGIGLVAACCVGWLVWKART